MFNNFVSIPARGVNFIVIDPARQPVRCVSIPARGVNFIKDRFGIDVYDYSFNPR